MTTDSKHGRLEWLGFSTAAFFAVCLTTVISGPATAFRAPTKQSEFTAKSAALISPRKPASLDGTSFERARELIAKRKLLKGRPESSIIEYFQEHPESLKHDLDNVVRELNSQPKDSDTTKHVRLLPPPGRSGYEDLRIYVSHPYRVGDKRMPADNLVQVLIDFIRLAKKEIALNVYEFDLDELATELIKAHNERKINVRVGIDQKPLHDPKRPKPKQIALFEKLKAGGIDVSEIDSSKINHQKMIAIDWSDPALARAMFSSGNFTHSCLDPLGDLYDVKPHAEKSIPNANHLITMKSWLAANLINHEVTKTKEMHLRGGGYPTSGAYQITGPGVDPETFEAYPENSFIIAFTPGGGNRSVGKNILAHLLMKSEGPVRMTQFAFSSKAVGEALLHRAERDLQANGKFDFVSVGDTPFAMQFWSQFLKMSGLKRLTEPKRAGDNTKSKKTVTYIQDAENPWVKSLSAEQLSTLRKNIRVAPIAYGKSHVTVAGQTYDIEAKVHHKLMSMGPFAVIGTSFNFSEGAENNNEQVLVFNDPKMAAIVRGITEELASRSPRSIYEEAMRRTARVSATGTAPGTAPADGVRAASPTAPPGVRSAPPTAPESDVEDDVSEDEAV